MIALIQILSITILSVVTLVTSTKFYASELYSSVAINRDSENVVISPFAVRVAMSALYVGSNNRTADEIKQGLNLNCPHKVALVEKLYEKLFHVYHCNATLKLSNSLIVDRSIPIRRPFKTLVGNFLDTKVVALKLLNGTADNLAEYINQAISAGTNDAIKKFVNVTEIPDDTRMLIASAIYFRDDWLLRFDRKNTKKDLFQNGDGTSVKVDMMQKEDILPYSEIEELNAKVLQLPFKHGNLSMLVIVPSENGGLQQLITTLRKFKIRRLTKQLQKIPIRVHLPKFQFDFGLKLKSILQNLGLKEIFSGANLHTMTKNSKNFKLFLNDLMHKTSIDIDEKGGEAIGPNLSNVASNSRSIPILFDVRRPFVFAIIDKKTEYFIGHVADLPEL